MMDGWLELASFTRPSTSTDQSSFSFFRPQSIDQSQDDEKLLEVVEARTASRGEAPPRESDWDWDWEKISSNFDGRTAAQCEAR